MLDKYFGIIMVGGALFLLAKGFTSGGSGNSGSGGRSNNSSRGRGRGRGNSGD